MSSQRFHRRSFRSRATPKTPSGPLQMPGGPFLLRGQRAQLAVATATEAAAALTSTFPGEAGVVITEVRTGRPISTELFRALRARAAAAVTPTSSIIIAAPRPPTGSSSRLRTVLRPPLRPRTAARPLARRAPDRPSGRTFIMIGAPAVIVLAVAIGIFLKMALVSAAKHPASSAAHAAVPPGRAPERALPDPAASAPP